MTGVWNGHKDISRSKGMINRYDSMILLIAIILSLAATDLKAQQDHIWLNHPKVFMKRERPPINFPHNRHVEGGLSCKDCHHQYKNGENVLDESTLQGRESGDSNVLLVSPDPESIFRKAIHYNIMSCHKKN